MLGHYSEVRAYVNRDDEVLQHADVFLDLDDDPVSKEAIQHDWSGMLFSQEENPFVDEDNDFILIAECNEVHGPMPLVTIPHDVGERMEHIDINSLVISILSVDYQQVGASSTFPKLDSQMLMPSIRDNLHIFVNYSVMLDPKARGFVRPMCIAYASSDKGKLVKNAPYIRTALIEASLALKLYNIKYFVQGIKNLLKDVKYTRRVTVGRGPCMDMVNGAAISEASFHESLNKYEDMLEATLQEVEDSLNANIPFSTEQARRIKHQAKDLVRHLRSLPKLVAELDQFLQFATQQAPAHEPRELKVPFQRDYEEGLVPLRDIWKKGFVLCIYWLYVTYKFFRRRAENLAMSLLQEKPLSCLRYGACRRVTESVRSSMSNLVTSSNAFCHEKPSRSSHSPCLYYRLGWPEFLPFEESPSRGNWEVDSGFFECFYHMGISAGERPSESRCGLHSSSTMPLPEAIQSRLGTEHRRSNSERHLDATETHCKVKTNKQLSRRRRGSGSSTNSDESGERSYWRRDGASVEPEDCTWHGVTLEKLWDAISLSACDGSESTFLEILHRHVKVEDLLYSLLTGRPIVVVGTACHRKEVEVTARLLALFAPRKFGDELWFEDDRTDVPDSASLSATATIGFVEERRTKDSGISSSIKKKASVFSVESGDFLGPSYSGSLLKQASQRIRLLDESEALLAVIGSILSDIEYTAHTWILLSSCGRKADSKAFSKQKQLSNCDMAILKHYEKLMGDLHVKK
ncbi:uncharacterized protein LOC8024854 isoform X8 [Ixodes scapularis]|uniref:uncharacterized protein LOC8024854 isoform X8 n=1 Tax=Ixodes scapularis TaxID=6945 RepID=UPI001A9CBA92|nr:uncharacterized protein LOC8024854 isoform X8 [Ixodes scapularis]